MLLIFLCSSGWPCLCKAWLGSLWLGDVASSYSELAFSKGTCLAKGDQPSGPCKVEVGSSCHTVEWQMSAQVGLFCRWGGLEGLFLPCVMRPDCTLLKTCTKQDPLRLTWQKQEMVSYAQPLLGGWVQKACCMVSEWSIEMDLARVPAV